MSNTADVRYKVGPEYVVMGVGSGHVHFIDIVESYDTLGDVSSRGVTKIEEGDSKSRSQSKICHCSDFKNVLVTIDSWEMYEKFHDLWSISPFRNTMNFLQFYCMSVNDDRADSMGLKEVDNIYDMYSDDWNYSDEDNLGLHRTDTGV